MTKEDFPIDEQLVEEFVKINTPKWNKSEGNHCIYLNFSMVRMQVAWIVPKIIYAKGLADKYHARVIVLTWRDNPLLTKFIESFGVEHISLHSIMNKNYFNAFKSGLLTLNFMTFKGSGEALKKLEICGIKAGKSLYEDILRTSNLSTIKSARNKICFKKMVHIFWMLYALNGYTKKNKPLICVADDIAYHEGLILKLMHSKGAKIYQSNYQQEREVLIDNNQNIETIASFSHKCYTEMVKSLDNDCIKWSEEYLSERFKGKNGRAIDRGAFANKKVLSKDDAIKEYSLDPNKKTVVIMAHTFSDAVYNYGELYFRDYYDWLEQTLKIASTVNNVNWVLKPHPTRVSYNESVDSIEKMFDKYKTDNMHFLSDDVSAESIINFADAQITIGGNSGGEFSCFGIPTVIVGKPYYHGFGYTIEPATFEDYKDCLSHLDAVKPLTDEQIVTAKKLFYLRNNESLAQGLYLYKDEFSDLINTNYKRMFEEIPLQYFAGNQGTEVYNNDVLQKVTDYFKNNDLKTTSYYTKASER